MTNPAGKRLLERPSSYKRCSSSRRTATCSTLSSIFDPPARLKNERPQGIRGRVRAHLRRRRVRRRPGDGRHYYQPRGRLVAASDGEGSPTSSHSSDGLSPVFESHYDRPSSAGSNDAELQHAGAAASWQYASARRDGVVGRPPHSRRVRSASSWASRRRFGQPTAHSKRPRIPLELPLLLFAGRDCQTCPIALGDADHLSLVVPCQETI